MKQKILIIEDESAIREMLAFSLHQAGYVVLQAQDANTALSIIDETPPDLIVVDWGLPKISGLELVSQIRDNETIADIPIIMLTARTQEEDKIRGLETGVDDYMTKPVSIKELQARIKAQLRRAKGFKKIEVIQVGAISMDIGSHTIKIDDNEIELSITEYNLLKLFIQNPGKLLSRKNILKNIWGRKSDVEIRTVDVHILRLRKSLKKFKQHKNLKTVRGAGYKLVDKN